MSFFDFHRQPASRFLQEAFRILAPDGHLLLGEQIEPRTYWNRVSGVWGRMHLQFVQRNPEEARGVFYDREEMIRMIFAAGFRQIVIQGLRIPSSQHQGVFSLVAATK